MIPARLEIHPRAIAECRAARRWYARRSAEAADRFAAQLGRAALQITASPRLWPIHLHGTRAFKLDRFPYLVIFREDQEAVVIVAVAHTSRRPGYWRKRTPP